MRGGKEMGGEGMGGIGDWDWGRGTAGWRVRHGWGMAELGHGGVKAPGRVESGWVPNGLCRWGRERPASEIGAGAQGWVRGAELCGRDGGTGQ
ncbi:hypothetical protein GCM10011609_81100 [Lentzea pudingi]|uniref:Uncharacterized protein n=1 Tax=Lentzea pudingi TaxID=1789439 RepID=A0ABQ2ITX4_9PSEU|nr:hypothetical protein GCM10011609_81100 [Lentzea pudingi]